MKKLIAVFSLIFLITLTAFSQKNTFSIGGGPSVSFALGNQNHNYYYKNGFGATLQANYGVTKLGTVTGTISYLSIGAKNPPVSNTSLTQIRVGYKTGFLNSGFFAAADAGISGYKNGLNNFVVSTAIGYSIKVSSYSFIDLFPSYSIITRTPNNKMWLSANALFRFKLQKKK